MTKGLLILGALLVFLIYITYERYIEDRLKKKTKKEKEDLQRKLEEQHKREQRNLAIEKQREENRWRGYIGKDFSSSRKGIKKEVDTERYKWRIDLDPKNIRGKPQ